MRAVLAAGVVVVCLFRTSAAQPAVTCIDSDRHGWLGSIAGDALLDFSMRPLEQLAFVLNAKGEVSPSPHRVSPYSPEGEVVYEPKRILVCASQGDRTCRAVGPKLRRYLERMRPMQRSACFDNPDPLRCSQPPPDAWLSSDRSVVLIGQIGTWSQAWKLKRDREIVVRESGEKRLGWTIAGGVLLAMQQEVFGPSGDKGFVVDFSGKVLSTISNGTPIVLSSTRAVIVSNDVSVLDLENGQTVATISLDKSDEILATALSARRFAAAWKTATAWTIVSFDVPPDDKPKIVSRGTLPFCP